MKQLFKTTLLAAAVTATCGTAVAGTVSVDKQVHSTEGLLGVTSTSTSNNITYSLGATYQEGDKLTLTFPTGTLDANNPTSGFPSVIVIPAVNGTSIDNTLAGLTWGLLNHQIGVSQNGVLVDTVTYRVTDLAKPKNTADDSTIDNGSTLGAVLGGGSDKLTISYKASALLNDKITVTVSSETANGDVLDSGGTRTATIAEAKSQFGTVSTSSVFNSTIDVAQGRKAFTDGAADTFTFSVDNPDAMGWLNQVTVSALKTNLYGEAGKMAGVKSTDFVTSGTSTFTTDEAKLAVTYTGVGTNDVNNETISFFAPTGTNAIILEPQSFSADMKYDYTSAAGQNATKTLNIVSAGEWTLNGATVNVPYMPYSATASQILYVTNAGDQVGDISVTAFDDQGKMYNLGVVGQAKAKTVSKITSQVGQALLSAGFPGTGKVSLTITVNAPAEDITVYASYNAGSVRGFVNTDQYKGMKNSENELIDAAKKAK